MLLEPCSLGDGCGVALQLPYSREEDDPPKQSCGLGLGHSRTQARVRGAKDAPHHYLEGNANCRRLEIHCTLLDGPQL